MSNIARLWQAIRQSGQGVYQPALARQQLTVVSVETDSNGAVTAARGTINGSGDFSVPVRGAGVRVGMLIGVTQPAHDPAAPLTFDGIDNTDDPSAGFSAEDDADLPVPAWAGTPLTTAIEASPGRISARVTAHFLPVSAKYKPSGYIVFYSLDSGTTWHAAPIDDDGSTSYAFPLPRSFAPGTSVEVKLRAVYKSGARSIASSTHTISAAADSTTPGTATTVTVDNTIAGQLLCTVTASTIDTSLFLKWRYEFSTSAVGPYSAATEEPGPCVFTGAAGAWYVRVAPVSKSGTVGTYTSWTGPTTLTTASAPLDVTAPAAWDAPTVSLTRVTPDTGGEYARLTVTLPARGGGFESDYARTIIRATNSTYYLERILQYNGSAPAAQTWENVAFGTWDVTLQAVDTSNNRSAASSAGSATLAASGVPGAATAPTVTQVGMALKVDYTLPANALAVEVQRADDAAFTVNAVTLTIARGLFFLDFAGTNTSISLPTYYYRVRGVNIGGNGAWSTGTSGTVLALHGNWLVADSITASQIAASAITASEIAANAVTAAKLEANLVVATDIRTASSGARVVLDGTNNRLGVYGASALLAALNGTALTFYRDGTNARTVFDTSGMQINNDSTIKRVTLDKDGLVVWNAAGTVQTVALRGDLLQIYTTDVGLGIGSSSAGGIMAIDRVNHGGGLEIQSIVPSETRGILVGSGTRGGAPGDFFTLRPDGTIGFGTGANYADIFIARMNGAYGLGFDFAAVTKATDIYSVRATATNGVIFLGDQSGGARYLFYNGTNYVMPGVQAVINGVTVGSDAALKDNIQPARLDLAKARGLRASTFTLKDDATRTPRLGFVAQDVLATIPEAHRVLGGEGEPASGYSLEALVAAQQEMIADLHARLTVLERPPR